MALFSSLADGAATERELNTARRTAGQSEVLPFTKMVPVPQAFRLANSVTSWACGERGAGYDCVVIARPEQLVYQAHVLRDLVGSLSRRPRRVVRAVLSWQAATTTDADRKAILRQVLDKVVLRIEGQSEWVEAWLHWAGGHQTYTRFLRPVARMTQLADWPLIRERIVALKAEGHTAQQIAEQLNREKRISPHHKPFTATTIRAALSRCGLTDVRRGASNDQLTLKEGEWFVPELARAVGVRPQVVYAWIRTGQLPARQVNGPQGRWIVHADAAELERLKAAPTVAGTQRRASA
jgi:hypothetical protein